MTKPFAALVLRGFNARFIRARVFGRLGSFSLWNQHLLAFVPDETLSVKYQGFDGWTGRPQNWNVPPTQSQRLNRWAWESEPWWELILIFTGHFLQRWLIHLFLNRPTLHHRLEIEPPGWCCLKVPSLNPAEDSEVFFMSPWLFRGDRAEAACLTPS